MAHMSILEEVEGPNVGQMADTNWAGPLLRAVMSADESNRELFAGSGYSQTVHRLCEHARALGSPTLWGASEVGSRLVGAMLLADPNLRVWAAGEPVSVVLIDGFVAGPAGVTLSASHVRSLGASQVTAMVIGLPSGQPAPAELHEEIQVVAAGRSAA